MAKKRPSSPAKRMTKAASQTRSTSSSTTAPMPVDKDQRGKKRSGGRIQGSEKNRETSDSLPTNHYPLPTLLTNEQQTEYRKLLAKGASPAGACQQLGFDLSMVAATMEQNDQFRAILTRVQELLSQNVAAALYRSAMEGSVSAQTFYLKNRPPPEWPTQDEETTSASLESLTDDELITQFRQAAPALLARLATGDSQTSGPSPTGPVPGTPPASQ
ncbi:MAG TPA: hypothetical protein VNQ76_09860 [Planctomicrobium sp.]|nr:hypothetical protein [Planctomicrobium sp.]